MQPKWETTTDHPLSSEQNVNNNNVLNQTSQTVLPLNAGEVNQEIAESESAIEDVNEASQPVNETNQPIEKTNSVGFFDDIKTKSQTILANFLGMFANNENRAKTSTKKVDQEFPISSVSYYQ